jgi:hypothetical protein
LAIQQERTVPACFHIDNRRLSGSDCERDRGTWVPVSFRQRVPPRRER